MSLEKEALRKEIYLKNSLLVEAQLILASSLEDEAACRKGIPNLAVSYPVYGKAILTKSHAGIRGALTLTEDYMTKIKESSQERERELEAFLFSSEKKEKK